MKSALFINGIYGDVLEEILLSQDENPGKVFYLQPYSSSYIKNLQKNTPNPKMPIKLYISTTTQLDKICYSAEIIGWEDKSRIDPERLAELNAHIKLYQPGENEIYLTTQSGQTPVNLISIINVERILNPISVTNLVKVSNNQPLLPRSRAGNWSYVYQLPEWINAKESTLEETYRQKLDEDIEQSKKLSEEKRRERLLVAPTHPTEIQVITRYFKRNPDVIVEVLNRANGICEKCHAPAPFLRAKDASPFLEIHHWVPLAKGGPDIVSNAAALCPNCHRKVHFGIAINEEE